MGKKSFAVRREYIALVGGVLRQKQTQGQVDKKNGGGRGRDLKT
jgi:hypothetical protein